jgi:hypothetical protein
VSDGGNHTRLVVVALPTSAAVTLSMWVIGATTKDRPVTTTCVTKHEVARPTKVGKTCAVLAQCHIL